MIDEDVDETERFLGHSQDEDVPVNVDDPIEDSQYAAHERDTGKSSIGRVTFNFVNAVIGSGVLAIPYALQESGLVLGVVSVVAVGLLCDYTVRLVVDTGLKEDVRNYEELLDKLFGFKGFAAISIMLFLYDFGAMLSYLIILADVSSSVTYEIATDIFGYSGTHGILNDHWGLRRACTISLSIILILPLCMLRDISQIEKASAFAVVTIVVVVLVMILATIMGDDKFCPPKERPCHKDTHWFTFFGDNPSAAFGIYAFSFVCHDTAFMFFNSLKNPTQRRWKATTHLSLGSAVLICLGMAVPAYVSFRGIVQQNILENFAPNDYKILIIRVLFMLTMSFTYPICFFICRHILNELIYRWQRRHLHRIPGTPSGVSVQHISKKRHLILTLSLFTSSLVICCFVDKLGLVMSITGNICAVSIAFVLPPLCAIQSRLSEKSNSMENQQDGEQSFTYSTNRWKNLLSTMTMDTYMLGNTFLLLFGLFTMIFCTMQTIISGG